MTQLEDTRPADEFKDFPKDQIVEDSFVYQPPLIPHSIRSYEVSLNANKCLACHSWKTRKSLAQQNQCNALCKLPRCSTC